MSGKQLRLARRNAGLSQYRLAQLSGVSRFVISQLECGYRRELTAMQRVRLSLALRDRACLHAEALDVR
jgi:transcriptional regulator with XRE-family HTH domain